MRDKSTYPVYGVLAAFLAYGLPYHSQDQTAGASSVTAQSKTLEPMLNSSSGTVYRVFQSVAVSAMDA